MNQAKFLKVLQLLLLGIGVTSGELMAQQTAGIRYVDSIFSEVELSTITYLERPAGSLEMDIYTPANDTIGLRPALLYVHGGGFAGGRRDEPRHIEFCKKMAAKGYVTASMSYTLTMRGQSFSCDQPVANKIETFRVVANEIAWATRFLLDRQEQYGIDSNKIVIAGSSAGAEAVLHAAYWQDTWIADNGQTLLNPDFRYGGVISMAGAITDLGLINSTSAIPTQLFHGTCDNLVPYANAPHHYCDLGTPGYLTLYGSKSIADKLQSLGTSYYLVTGCLGGHEWAGKPLSEHVQEIANFIFQDVIQGAHRQIHLIYRSGESPCPQAGSFSFCEP